MNFPGKFYAKVRPLDRRDSRAVQCTRCSCQALIGHIPLRNGDDLIFRTDPCEGDLRSPPSCRNCEHLPYLPSRERGLLKDMPQEARIDIH